MEILDLYDDPSGSVLRQHNARTGGMLTEKLAALELVEVDKLAGLPDRLFALVGTCDGERVRKYAMHDPAHLATSIVYFLECGGALPDGVRAKVAGHLVEACGWYETAPPPALIKVAFLGAATNAGLTLLSAPAKMMETKAKNTASDQALRAAQMSGLKQAARPISANGEEEAWRAIDRFIRGEESPEELLSRYDDNYPNPFSDPQHLVKDAAPMSTALQPFKSVTNHITRQGRLADSITRKQDLADALSSSAWRKADPARVRRLQGRLDERVKKLRRVHQAEGRAGFDQSWEAEAPLREEYVKTRKFAAEIADVVKEANTAGTEVHSFGGLSQDPRPQTPAKRFATALKTSGLASSVGSASRAASTAAAAENPAWSRLSRLVNVHARAKKQGIQLGGIYHGSTPSVYPSAKLGHEVGDFELLAPTSAPASATHYALPQHGLYPIDTVEQVKRASAYFAEHGRAFELDDRRVFAQSVATRAEELGVKVSAAIENVAGDTYGPHIVPELYGRIRALEGTGKEAAYEVLLDHVGDTPPIVMVDMIKQADEETGLDNGYGRPVTGFRDPLSAVFGAPEKPIYSWADRGQYVTEEMLRSYAKNVPDLDKVIDEGFSIKFINDPIKAFEGLPTAKKIVVARLANNESFRYV